MKMKLPKIPEGLKNAGRTAKNVVKKTGLVTAKGTSLANKGSQFANDAYDNGLENAVGHELKTQAKQAGKRAVSKATQPYVQAGKKAAKKVAKKAGQQAVKAGMHAIHGAVSFMVSNPIGWAIGAVLVLLVLFMLVKANTPSTNPYQEDAQTAAQMQKERYIATLASGCPTSAGDADPDVHIGDLKMPDGLTNRYGLNDVARFASSSIRSTWGVSIKRVESFCSRIAAVNKYHLSAHDMGRVSQAVANEGVSPVLFWLYAKNEGGGAGGFINHFASGHDTGDPIRDAIADAKYIKAMASAHGYPPAREGAISDYNKYAQKFLDRMPNGSIGRIYVPATAAVTAEICGLNGVKSTWTHSYGWPLSSCMNWIEQLGGDYRKADQITVSMKADGENCNDDDDNFDKLPNPKKGMTLKKARKFMAFYYRTHLRPSDYAGAARGKPNVHDNCTVFTAWFLNKYTKIGSVAGNGKDIVRNLNYKNHKRIQPFNMKITYFHPKMYSVFSIEPNKGPKAMGVGDFGHTGIILGYNKKRHTYIIGQGEYGHRYTNAASWSSGANAQEIPEDWINPISISSPEPDDLPWEFINVNKVLKQRHRR